MIINTRYIGNAIQRERSREWDGACDRLIWFCNNFDSKAERNVANDLHISRFMNSILWLILILQLRQAIYIFFFFLCSDWLPLVKSHVYRKSKTKASSFTFWGESKARYALCRSRFCSLFLPLSLFLCWLPHAKKKKINHSTTQFIKYLWMRQRRTHIYAFQPKKFYFLGKYHKKFYKNI